MNSKFTQSRVISKVLPKKALFISFRFPFALVGSYDLSSLPTTAIVSNGVLNVF